MPMLPERLRKWETGAYQIENLLNGKVYVGGAYRSFGLRWRGHRSALRAGRHCSKHLQAAWNKYGEQAFRFQVLERCPPVREQIIRCEQRWLDLRRSYLPERGYNSSPTAGSNLGYKHSDSARQRMSASAQRKPPISEATRQRISETSKGRRHTEKSRKKLSEKARTREATPAGRIARQATIAGSLGKPKTEETKNKVSRSRRGKLRGEQNHLARFTEGQVLEIKNLLLEGKTQKEVAQMFGTVQCTISAIRTGRMWGWLTGWTKSPRK